MAKLVLRVIGLGYLAALLVLPVLLIVQRTFSNGLPAVWMAVTAPDALHALWLTLTITAIVVPANAVFGVLTAILLVRHRFPGRTFLSAVIDLPLGVSPVVIGLALIVIYGRFGWFGPWLQEHNLQVIFSTPGMVLATIFISLPFVTREVVPVLQEIGTDQEQAASTLGASALQTFVRITLPAIRNGLSYGIVLTTARALGEYGAVSVVSGRIEGQTQTLTLYVQDRFEQFDVVGSYSAAILLALLALAMLWALNATKPKERTI